MGGWNIFYALINFLILAAILFFAGRKLVISKYREHRDTISDGLKGFEQAADRLKLADDTVERMRHEAEQERISVMAQAEKTAGINSALAEEENVRLRLTLEKALDDEASMLRRELSGTASAQAAEDICVKARALLSDSRYDAAKRRLSAAFPGSLEKVLTLSAGDRAKTACGDVIPVVLTVADETDRSISAAVKELIDRLVPSGKAAFSVSVDPRLIGGVKLQIGDTVYDGSLQSRLLRAEKSISAGGLPAGSEDSSITARIARTDRSLERVQIGRIVTVADGICRISGLSDVMAGEMVELDGGLIGLIMDIETDTVSAVLLGSYDSVRENDLVKCTGRVVQVPVGEAMIGRVVDGLGRPLDGMGKIDTDEFRDVESPAPPIIARKPVSVPMQTGIKAIDALVPIGRGQRELIIGDRKTGKTSIAIDTIINQKDKNVVCIYVAIGQKESTVAGIVDKLREYGAMSYTIVVVANASDPAPMLYIAPYAGTAMGEYLMHKGRDVLIIYDDLSKHAVAYREISLLLHRPPGREAYPGDVFYLHSRLLERSACLSDEYGGGTLTALPIVETLAGDISSYIPTNVISITDGQIFLDDVMFNSGTRPAVNAGLSVSRVGGSAQPAAMKKVSGRLRMDLAQHRELEAFTQFGSDLDPTTKAALNRGSKMVELLKQGRYSPMDTASQVVAVFCGNEGFLDDIDLNLVSRFEQGVTGFVRQNAPELCRRMNNGDKLGNEDFDALRRLIGEYSRQFSAENL